MDDQIQNFHQDLSKSGRKTARIGFECAEMSDQTIRFRSHLLRILKFTAFVLPSGLKLFQNANCNYKFEIFFRI